MGSCLAIRLITQDHVPQRAEYMFKNIPPPSPLLAIYLRDTQADWQRAKARKALQLSSQMERCTSPTPSQVGSEYWDPPCRICKVIDDEANVLCELCNDAFHLTCLEHVKPPLPRSPEDEEWFCRGCIKKGVPEAILDRTGRLQTHPIGCVSPPERQLPRR